MNRSRILFFGTVIGAMTGLVAAMLLTGPLAFFVGKKVRRSSTDRHVLPEWGSPK